MKKLKRKIQLLLMVFAVLTLAGALKGLGGETAPLNPEFVDWNDNPYPLYDKDGHWLGAIPSPFDWSHLAEGPAVLQVEGAPPASYDLRSSGAGGSAEVTSVKDQGNCGSCWTFATYGSLESWLLKNRSETWNLSENHLKNYHDFGLPPCQGGNAKMSTAYLARWSGPAKESDCPYFAGNDKATANKGAPLKKQLKNALWFYSATDIKNALMTYGAMYTTLYYDSDEYDDVGHTYYYSDDENPNHAVTLAGWDDNKVVAGAPSNGAWLAKNSWGTGWGNSGYFWISYNDTQAVKFAVAFCNAVPPSTYATNYQYDHFGFINAYGGSSTTGWGANVFTATASERLAAVAFYATAENTSYEIWVYDNFNGSSFSNLLLGPDSGTVSQFGYHTITLSSTVNLTKGNDFSIVIKFTTPGYNYPVPVEYKIPGYADASVKTQESYWSATGANGTWNDLGAASSVPRANICIKGLTIPPHKDGPHKNDERYIEDTGTHEVIAGEGNIILMPHTGGLIHFKPDGHLLAWFRDWFDLFVATYFEFETYMHDPFDPNVDDVTFTEVWSYNLDPNHAQGVIPELTGFNPFEPEMVPEGDGWFEGRSGTQYPSTIQTCTLAELPDLLPGYDLSKFTGDPNSIVYVQRATVPAADFIAPEIPTLSQWGLIVLAVLLMTAGAIAIRRRLQAAA